MCFEPVGLRRKCKSKEIKIEMEKAIEEIEIGSEWLTSQSDMQ